MKHESSATVDWQAFIEAFAGPILIINHDGQIIYVNHAACHILGRRKDYLINENFSFPFELEVPSEIEILTKNNVVVYAQMYVKKLVWNQENAYVVTLFDISEFKRVEKQLRISNIVFKYAKEGIIITDSSGVIIDVNDEFCKITGYDKSSIIGVNPNILNSGRQSKEFYAAMWADIINSGFWVGHIWNKRKDGANYPQTLTISAVKNEADDVTNYVGVFYDDTEQVNQLDLQKKIPFYDIMTNLPNRYMLGKLLDNKMKEAKYSNHFIAIIYLDIDNLKIMVNKYGEAFGDELIQSLSTLLSSLIRPCDILSRCADDEFAIVLTKIDKLNDYKEFMSQLYLRLNSPLQVGVYNVNVGISAGVALYPSKNDLFSNQLIRHASRAMYEAKTRGKNRYVVFDSDKEMMLENDNIRSNDLMKAMNNDEFRLFFQPKINIKTRKLLGVEALLRWQHPSQGLLMPSQFLPAVMTSEFKINLDKWVITAAIDQMQKWRMIGQQITISVNVNAVHLMNNDFIIWLKNIIIKTPKSIIDELEFEILESSMIYDLDKLSVIMNECNELGIYFSLDDFGTAYSSLSYLKSLPLRYMKIDQGFVKNILDSQSDVDIFKGILSLAKAINIKVIAEGVESEEQLALLRELNCNYAQGYLISEPKSSDEFISWLSGRP